VPVVDAIYKTSPFPLAWNERYNFPKVNPSFQLD